MLTMMGLHDSAILLIRMDPVLSLQTHVTLQAISVSSSSTSGCLFLNLLFCVKVFLYTSSSISEILLFKKCHVHLADF